VPQDFFDDDARMLAALAALPSAAPRAGAYLFDVSTDPTEATNLLWNLPGDQKAAAKATAALVHTDAALIEKRALSMLALLCAEYDRMAPAQWKPKLGFPKKLFKKNKNFVT
jgi:hypothetical protein